MAQRYKAANSFNFFLKKFSPETFWNTLEKLKYSRENLAANSRLHMIKHDPVFWRVGSSYTPPLQTDKDLT